MTAHRSGCPAMTLYDDLAHENGLPVVRKSTGRHHLSNNWRWTTIGMGGNFRVNLTGGAFGPINPPLTDGQAWDKWRQQMEHP